MMTIQKAMRARADLKKESIRIKNLLDRVGFNIEFKTDSSDSQTQIVNEETVEAARNENKKELDGHTYKELFEKQFLIADEILKLNLAIEAANKNGHDLLFEESTYKAKLALVESVIANRRNVPEKSETWVDDLTKPHYSEKTTTYDKKSIKYEYFPMLKDELFGKKLEDLKSELADKLSDIRDKLTVFNATQAVEYELPKGLI